MASSLTLVAHGLFLEVRQAVGETPGLDAEAHVESGDYVCTPARVTSSMIAMTPEIGERGPRLDNQRARDWDRGLKQEITLALGCKTS
jgi:hypothetical protein